MSIATRGRLINKFVAVIRRLDTAAIETDGNYDPLFDAVARQDDGTQTGATGRKEMAEIKIPAQLDRDEDWGAVQASRGGKQIKADLVLALHWPDLEKRGLIDGNGEPVLKRGDRIVKIETRKGNVEATFDGPGMYVTDLERAGYGQAPFGNPRTNLLYLHCSYQRVADVGPGALL